MHYQHIVNNCLTHAYNTEHNMKTNFPLVIYDNADKFA